MAGYRFKFKINNATGIDDLRKKLKPAAIQAEHALAVQIAKDTEPYVPAQNKNLVNGAQVHEMVYYYCTVNNIQDIDRNSTYHNKQTLQRGIRKAQLAD